MSQNVTDTQKDRHTEGQTYLYSATRRTKNATYPAVLVIVGDDVMINQ